MGSVVFQKCVKNASSMNLSSAFLRLMSDAEQKIVSFNRLKSLLTPWRLKWYSFSVLLGLFIALLIVLFSGTGPKILSGRLGGDFPAFYAAGRIVSTSGFNELYNLDQQIKQQEDLFPDEKSYLPFSYPPFVALAYAPISLLPYRIAFLLNLIVSISAFFMAFVCLKPIIQGLDEFLLPVFTLSFTFYPFLKSNLGGQNTALTLMLLALIWRSTKEDRQYLAGISMGLLLYKPQFGIPLIGLFILSGRYKIALSGIAAGCLLIAIGLFFTGIQPYKQWYNFISWFNTADANVNSHNAVSWIGFLYAIFGPENRMAFIIGVTCCFATVSIISYIWIKGRTKSGFNAQMGLAVVSIILISPHSMFYDAGLIILTYAVIITKIQSRKIELICFVWLAGITQIFANQIGFSPIFFLVVLTFIVSLVHIAPQAMKRKVIRSISGC